MSQNGTAMMTSAPYNLSRAYDDILLSSVETGAVEANAASLVEAKGGVCEVWLTLDGPKAQKGQLRIERWNAGRREAVLEERTVAMPADAGRLLWSRPRVRCGIKDPRSQFLAAFFTPEGGETRRSLLFFVRPVHFDLQAGGVVAGARPKGDGVEVAVRSRTLALACELHAPVAGRFSDNGFDLLPGETRIVAFHPAKPGSIEGAWDVMTLNQMQAESRRP